MRARNSGPNWVPTVRGALAELSGFLLPTKARHPWPWPCPLPGQHKLQNTLNPIPNCAMNQPPNEL